MNSMVHPMTPVSLGKRKVEDPEPEQKPFIHPNFAPSSNIYNTQAPIAAGPSNAQFTYNYGGLNFYSDTNATVHAFDEHQAAKWDGHHGPQSRGLAAGNFAINYDEERPIRQEEIDGRTQEEQYVYFLLLLVCHYM